MSEQRIPRELLPWAKYLTIADQVWWIEGIGEVAGVEGFSYQTKRGNIIIECWVMLGSGGMRKRLVIPAIYCTAQLLSSAYKIAEEQEKIRAGMEQSV
jgi:hypothetical protein